MSESLHQRREGGKRTDWTAAERPADKPLITIITSTFNAVRDLPWTFNSLHAQTYPHIQWIVADGASTDGTVEWLLQHDELVDVWFSGPDSGIYDAWNKAVAYAQGDWIQFIGAGDELADPTTLAKLSPVLARAYPAHDLVYGKLQFLSEKNRTILDEVGEPWAELKGRWQLFLPMLPMHPSIFAHASLFSGGKTFDARYRIAADALFLSEVLQRKDPLFVEMLIDKMPLGGVSGRLDSITAVAKEYKKISKQLGFEISMAHRIKEDTKLAAKVVLFRCLPASRVYRVADLYRTLLGRRPRWTIE